MPASGARACAAVSPTRSSISAAARASAGATSASISATSITIIRTAPANGFGSYGEVYAKPSYKVADWLTIGGVFDGFSNLNNKYLAAFRRLRGPVGRRCGRRLLFRQRGHHLAVDTDHRRDALDQSRDRTSVVQLRRDAQYRRPLGVQSYTYWDVGFDINYKAITLDLRYWDTNANANDHMRSCGRRQSPGHERLRLQLRRHAEVRHLAVGSQISRSTASSA